MTQISASAGGQNPAPVVPFQGYARHFEIRPEPLYSHFVRLMVDASPVRKRQVGELKVFYIPHVFAGANEVFMGFGKPNTYLVVPDGKEHEAKRAGRPTYGYQKFAGKSLKRAPSVIEDTKLWVQAGVHVRFLGLPDRAVVAIRAAMEKHHGNKYWTCVNACLRVLEDAGFTLGSGRRLSTIYFPYQLFNQLREHGLYFDGQPVGFEYVRTSDWHLEKFFTDVIIAELLTFQRHADRAIEGKAAAGSRVWKAIHAVRHAPGKLLGRVFPEKKVEEVKTGPVADPLPEDGTYVKDLTVYAGKSSGFGILMRLMWGQHTLFCISQNRVNVSNYLPEALVPFPQKNPNIATRLKKRILFSPLVVRFILHHLAPDWEPIGTFDERMVHTMLRTHSDEVNNKYNMVILRNGDILLSRVASGNKLAAWILSKHVLMANWAKDLPWAGEGWKNVDSSAEVDGNSGTYQPSEAQDIQACAYVNAVCPSWKVVRQSRQRG